jgi:hypothetical protein
MKKHVMMLPLLLASCASPSYITQTQLDSELESLNQANAQIRQEIQVIRECDYWRSTYVREGNNCIQGLSVNTMQELLESEGELNREMFQTRRNNACMFACHFEVRCQHEVREVCSYADIEIPEEQDE